jgi:hypothetical protein
LARRLAENPNPSKSALVGSVAGQAGLLFHNPVTLAGYTVAGRGLAKMLRNPDTIEALISAMQPLTGKAATRQAIISAGKGVAIGNVLKLAGQDAKQVKSNDDALQFQPSFGSEPLPRPGSYWFSLNLP